MLINIATIQLLVFVAFFILEKKYPARYLPRNPDFLKWWVFAQVFAILWIKVLIFSITEPTNGVIQTNLNFFAMCATFFLVYTFLNYWWHRLKHSNQYIWRYIHRFHHAPSKMETALLFFKHPLEIIANSVLIYVIAWLLSLPVEAVAVGLLIEGIIETYHHANINTPKNIRWISKFIQTPEMHLIHHQKGLHKYNYVTFLWDTVFKTAKIPENWDEELGLNLKNGIKDIFLCKK